MKINVNRISTDFKGEYCYTHARGAISPSGFGIITTQPLRLSGSDIFYGMHMLKTFDGGRSWSGIQPCEKLGRIPLPGGEEMALADATPMYHKATGKIILIGLGAYYKNDSHASEPIPGRTYYSVYDEQKGDFGELRMLDLPQGMGEEYFCCHNGCGQSYELENGELLIPVTHHSRGFAENPWGHCAHSAVIKAGFDGERLHFLEIGASLSCDVPRGVYEPSVTSFGGEYFICLRNDKFGYVAKSDDGLNYSEPKPLRFDDGSELGNYNTQQHWINGSGKLLLVYTRRGACNDHVFRHRAPLFIAEFDTERMCVVRSTEQVAVPERGARLGNFGCVDTGEGRSLVIASEWMQTVDPNPSDWRKCVEYGSDNSIFVSEIIF